MPNLYYYQRNAYNMFTNLQRNNPSLICLPESMVSSYILTLTSIKHVESMVSQNQWLSLKHQSLNYNKHRKPSWTTSRTITRGGFWRRQFNFSLSFLFFLPFSIGGGTSSPFLFLFCIFFSCYSHL